MEARRVPSFDLAGFLAEVRARVDQDLDAWLPPPACAPSALHEAMRYAVFSGGKRLRPALAFAAARIWREDVAPAVPVASATELVHAYSLVHDDLPAMDDDVERRGKPTVHVKFGHALGILTGDALLALAFERLGEPRAGSALFPQQGPSRGSSAGPLVGLLGRAAGSRALVGGQVDDLASGSGELSFEQIISIHRRKTAALFSFAVCGGALISGASEPDADALAEFAEAYGLAFQAADDLVDRGRSETSILQVCGEQGARAHLSRCVERARLALDTFGRRADALRALALRLTEPLR